MPVLTGRTRNENDTSVVSSPIVLNSTTAVTISSANSKRMFFECCVTPETASFCVFIRLYPASQDNSAKGFWVGSYQSGNDVYFKPDWRMPVDTIYTGEISAILCPGEDDKEIYVTEY